MTARPPLDQEAAAERRRNRAARLGQAAAMGFGPGHALGLVPPDDAPATDPVQAAPAARQEPTPTVPAQPMPPVAPPPGHVVVDAAALARLREDAAAPERIAAERATREREQLITAAVRRGAVLPADRQHWLNNLEHEPATADALAARPDYSACPALAPPIGHAGGMKDDRADPLERLWGTRR